MAQLLSPVFTEALKFQNPLLPPSTWRVLARTSSINSLSLMGHAGKRRACGRVRVATEGSTSVGALADDYYSVLGLVIASELICVLFA